MQLTKETQEYTLNGQSYEAYIAKPANAQQAPAVLVVHEWWGLNDYVRGRAEQLAELGYVAIAIDMYGVGQRADSPEQAQALMESCFAAPELIPARFDAALAFCQSLDAVDANRIAAIGYCFGGAVVLNMARAGKALAAVCSFHGLLETESPLQAGVFNGKIAVYSGADDPMVGSDIVEGFREEMRAADADLEMQVFPGVVHGFTNPAATARGEKYGLPLRYSEQADQSSWASMQNVLDTAFTR